MSPEPGPEFGGVPVTGSTWQAPPVNRWAYWHVSDILPTYTVSRGTGPVRPLPPWTGSLDVTSVAVTRLDGAEATVDGVLDDTYTDAYLVLQDGALVTEWYGPGGGPDQPHALMSVTKSLVGCVAAVLIDQGQLEAGAEIARYVPELARSGYAGATVRNVL